MTYVSTWNWTEPNTVRLRYMAQVTLIVGDREYLDWQRRAARMHYVSVEAWISSFVHQRIEIEDDLERRGELRHQTDAARVHHCLWCGTRLDGGTLRRRFCSGRCRVAAWRAGQPKGRD
jgi:hypothetical protein